MRALAAGLLLFGLSTAQAQPGERPSLTQAKPEAPRLTLSLNKPGIGVFPCGSLDLSCDITAGARSFDQIRPGDPAPVPALTIRFGGEKQPGKPSIIVRTGHILQTALFVVAVITTFLL
ncbi:MAG: hypothetical protein HY926_16180 [Elusimicrobia bacterium]|nr:hypothetical protein [Elusimicrobiota bacterium]